MQGDIWAITPATSATLLRAAASIAEAGAVTLLTNDVAANGAGYKLLFTSVGDDSGITFTIVGVKVGDLTGANTTEVVTGADEATATSTNFYCFVQSITASGASAGNVSIGTTGSLALPRTRIKSLYYVGTTNAGSIRFNVNSPTGSLILQLNTPAGATAFADSLFIPAEGLLTTRSTIKDFAVLTLSEITNVTVFCG
jgi:hypothetical protein